MPAPSTRRTPTCRELKSERFDRVFVALHGRHGEDGTVQGALELLGIPYTGSGVMASAICMDKVMTKRVWVAEGLPTPRWVWLARDQIAAERLRTVPDELGLPLIVKPPREGSSIGITKVMGYSQMHDAVQLSLQYDADLLCEEFIEGIELTCPVLGEGADARALPVIRIDAPGGNYDFEHKYYSDDTGYRCPSGLPRGRGSRGAAPGAGRLPQLELPRLGPRRPDAARTRPQAVPAGDEHLAGHDRAFAGADVGARRRHELRAAVPAAAVACRAGRRARREGRA